MSERKYGQRGYMDTSAGREREPEREKPRPKGPPKGALRDIPKNIKMPGFQEVMRCSLCGAIVPQDVEVGDDSQCPKCNADLKTCKNCRHFDTGAQFECTQQIPERVMKKDMRNKIGRAHV